MFCVAAVSCTQDFERHRNTRILAFEDERNPNETIRRNPFKSAPTFCVVKIHLEIVWKKLYSAKKSSGVVEHRSESHRGDGKYVSGIKEGGRGRYSYIRAIGVCTEDLDRSAADFGGEIVAREKTQVSGSLLTNTQHVTHRDQKARHFFNRVSLSRLVILQSYCARIKNM